MSSSSPLLEPPQPNEESATAGGTFRRAPDAAPAAAADEPARRQDHLIEVVVRLSDGDTALVRRFVDFEEARSCALSLVQGLCRGDAGDWPFIGGRFLRPGAVVSVDIVESDAPKWAGSSERASTWTGREDDPISLRTTSE